MSISTTIPPKQGDFRHFLKVIKVDSLKLRIPIQKVTFVSSTFCEEYKKIYISTGEIEEEINLEKHKTSIFKGITTRIGVVSCMTGKDKQEEFVYFQINSKMCKERYLEGVTSNTIRSVYDYIIDLKIVAMAYDDFLEGYVTDIDFAYDFEISPENMKNMNSQIYSKVRADRFKFVDKPFGKDDNIGLQFNRRDKATPTSPFIKIYHKGVEFKHHSNEFYLEYLSKYNLENYGRLEYTLKNRRHQKHLGIEIKTMNQLLKSNPQTNKDFVLHGIPENYIEPKITLRDYSKLSPTHRLIICLITEIVERGGDRRHVERVLTTFDDNSKSERRDKSRLKNLINELMERVQIGDKNKIKMNIQINDALIALNIDKI